MMLDVQTGSITPFLELKYPDPNFTPIDLAFDYNNNALYVVSAGNNGDDDEEEDVNNNATISNTDNLIPATNTYGNNDSGVLWKISYQADDEERGGGGRGEMGTISDNEIGAF